MKRNAYALTDIGLKRKINQDAFLKDDALGLYIVADGMGGHRGGEVASKLAVQTIQQYCQSNPGAHPREILDKGINASCQKIYEEANANEELAGMGTTIVALYFDKSAVFIGQVGDSRAYLMRKEGIWQLTEDHSLVNEEIRAGRLVAGQAAAYQFRNVITRSVGYENRVNVDIYRREVQVGDIFLLCTDGLSGTISMAELHQSVYDHGPEVGLKKLLSLANARGGEDNITGLVCEVASLD